MVRVFIKGGVWKNSEDEILKAAVMKYGKQQWARVASLLNRKSAKQCKARWNEWLDPSIKKLEDWSREEDERLLHLAKLMPAQFKTIGPLVGNRTAQQCLERYERLLDQAATASDPNHSASATTAASSSDQLRPGDIDAHPETKPARPDPIDMDEDEMEMLQEARARLANTQGKKAKRKARERMLNDAKRLADLQKRRELKQAGLLSGSARQTSRGKRHRREIDLGVEIPFYKPARSDGQHDTTLEDVRAYQLQKQHLTRINYKQINEQAYNTRDREQKQAQKKQEARLRQLERDNMQYVVSKVSQLNDPISSKQRPLLAMPPPTNDNNNLNDNKQDSAMIAAANHDPTSATSVLLQDLGNRPLPTPMRTPATQTPGMSRQQAILREASQLRSLQQAQTPLLMTASKNDDDNDDNNNDDADNNIDPNNIHNDRHSFNATPGAASVMMNDDAMSVTTTSTIKQIAKQERRAAKRIRLELEQALAKLPAPQFEYELAVPTTMEEDQDETLPKEQQDEIILDQAERDAMEIEKQRKEQQLKYQTTVMKRNLPRPLSTHTNSQKNKSLSYAQQLIEQEYSLLLQHDAYQHPIVPFTNDFQLKSKKKKSAPITTKLPPKPSKPLDQDLPLELAQQLLQDECNDDSEEVPFPVSEEEKEQFIFVPGNVGWTSTPSDKERVKAYQMEYKSLTEQSALLEKQCHKLQSKLDTIVGGYAPKLTQLKQTYAKLNDDFQEERTSKHIYSYLHELEKRGLQSRLSSIQQEVHQLQQDETKGQKLYGDLLHEKNRLLLRLKQ